MTAAEWLEKTRTYCGDMGVDDFQSILDDGRVQGMREAAELVGRTIIGNSTGHCTLIREHADKLAKGEK